MHGRFSMHRRDCVLQSRAVKSAKEPHHSSGDDVIVRFDCGVSGLGSIKPPQHLKSHRLGSGSSNRFSRNSIKPTVRVVDPASASTDTSGVIGFRTGLDSVLNHVVDLNVQADIVEAHTALLSTQLDDPVAEFDGNCTVASFQMEVVSRLDTMPDPTSGVDDTTAIVPMTLDLVTWCRRRRSLVESTKVSPSWLSGVEAGKAIAGTRTEELIISPDCNAADLAGTTVVTPILDLVAWAVRRRHLVESTSHHGAEWLDEKQGGGQSGTSIAPPIAMLDVNGEFSGRLMLPICQPDFTVLDRGDLVCSSTEHFVDGLISIHQDYGFGVPDAPHCSSKLDLNLSNLETKVPRVDGDVHVATMSENKRHECETTSQFPTHTMATHMGSAELHSACGVLDVMLSRPDRCAVQIASSCYLRGSCGFPTGWQIPVIEIAGLLQVWDLPNADPTRTSRRRTCNQGAVQDTSALQGALQQTCSDDQLKAVGQFSRETRMQAQGAFGWHVTTFEVDARNEVLGENTFDGQTARVEDAVSHHLVSEDYFPPLATFELPRVILHGQDVGQSAIAVTGQMTSFDGDKNHDEIETDALGYVFSSGELGATDVSLSQADPRPQLSLADDGTLILPPDFQQLAVEKFHSDEFTVEQTAEAAENPPIGWQAAFWSSESWTLGHGPQALVSSFCIVVDRQPLMHLRSFFGGQHVVGAWIHGAHDTIHGGHDSGMRVDSGVTTPPGRFADAAKTVSQSDSGSGSGRQGNVRFASRPHRAMVAIEFAQQSIQAIEFSKVPTWTVGVEHWAA